MVKPLAVDSSKWYRYSLPVDENLNKTPPEKGKKRRKRRKVSAVPSSKRGSGPAARSRSRAGSRTVSRAGSRASSLARSLAGSRAVSRAWSRAGSLAPSVAGSPLLLQPPRPPQLDAQRRDSAAKGSLAPPVQQAQAGLPHGQGLPKPSQGAEDVDQYGPATRFAPPVWQTGCQGPEVIMATTADATDPRYTDRYHRTACVFHASADGLEPVSAGRSARCGLSVFPFALYRVALFCCPSLAVNVEPGSEYPGTMTAEFSSRALRTGFVEPFMMLGDSSQSSQAPFEQLLDDLEALSLPDAVRSWYKTRNYTGVVLRLPEAVSASTWLRAPSLLGQLAQTLVASPNTNVRLGVALRQDARGADLRGLAAVLGLVSVFLLPPAMTLPRYFGESTLASLTQLYAANFGPDHGQSVCYLLPAEDTYTFQCQAQGLPWERAKGFATSCPVGQFLPKESAGDPHTLTLWCKVNGKQRQQGSTSNMLFTIQQLLEAASARFTLEPGDLLLTGTPSGVGPVDAGDVVEAGTEGHSQVRFPVEQQKPKQ